MVRARLQAEGLFDASRKRAMPPYPSRIGVITSPSGAAVRDVVSVLGRRFPLAEVDVLPVPVQGEGAPPQIRAMLQRAAASGRYDMLLLTRGGGSLEDLWSFNDPELVRLMARAPMPVVCGVGHETDFTLADFVADLRAPTPTAAAELCAPAREQRVGELDYLQERLDAGAWSNIDQRGQRLDRLAQRMGRPSSRLHDSAQQLGRLQHRLQGGWMLTTQQRRNRLAVLQTQLPLALRRAMDAQQRRLQRCELSLGLLDPQLVLERGYAFLTDAQGVAVTRAAQAQAGQALTATLADGTLDVRVEPDIQRP